MRQLLLNFRLLSLHAHLINLLRTANNIILTSKLNSKIDIMKFLWKFFSSLGGITRAKLELQVAYFSKPINWQEKWTAYCRTHLGFSFLRNKPSLKDETLFHLLKMAPWEGFEPPTKWLTVTCSTTELPRNIFKLDNRIKFSNSKIKRRLNIFFNLYCYPR